MYTEKEVNEAKKQCEIQVKTLLRTLNLIAAEDSYDKKCSKKFMKEFATLHFSYNKIRNYINYIHKSSRMFKCEHCLKIVSEIELTLRRFTSAYGLLL